MQLALSKTFALQWVMVETCQHRVRVGARGTWLLTEAQVVPGPQHAQREREQNARRPASVSAHKKNAFVRRKRKCAFE